MSRDRPVEVENALALALYRRYEPRERSAENMGAPKALHVWGTRRGGEIDFGKSANLVPAALLLWTLSG